MYWYNTNVQQWRTRRWERNLVVESRSAADGMVRSNKISTLILVLLAGFLCLLGALEQAHAQSSGDTPDSLADSVSAPFDSPLPPPVADFFINPWSPSTLTPAAFYAYPAYDPAGQGLRAWNWNFGDGSTGKGLEVQHQYAAEGDYNVRLTVVTNDGRRAAITRLVRVSNHDVAIVKFARPKSGRAGKQVRLTVGIANSLRPETVTVEIYKSIPGGYGYVGSWTQEVIVQSSPATTNFIFFYTPTDADAAIGKVTFKAVARLQNADDSWPADNEFITFPMTVAPRVSGSRQGEAVEDLNAEESSEEITDTASNTAADGPILISSADALPFRIYTPFVAR